MTYPQQPGPQQPQGPQGQPNPYQQTGPQPQYGYPPQQGYQPQPFHGAHPIALPPTSGKATAAMILGLMGLLTCGFTSLPAIILGHMAEGETRTGTRGGRGMAITGLIFGYLTAVPWIIFWGMVITGAASAPFLPASPSITPFAT